jgi:hypothetical protein
MIAGVIGAIVLGGFIWLLIFLNARQKKLREIFWNELGNKYNLTLTSKKKSFLHVALFSLEGTIAGRQVNIRETVKGSGNHQRYYVTIEIPCSPGFSFCIRKEGILTQIVNLVGIHDIILRDDEIDRAYHLKSDNEDEFRRLLVGNKLEELRAVKNQFDGVLICDNYKISYTVQMQLNNSLKVSELESAMAFMLLLISK